VTAPVDEFAKACAIGSVNGREPVRDSGEDGL